MSHERVVLRPTMTLPTAALAGTYPVRAKVYWGRHPRTDSDSMSMPVTGRRVVIIQLKQFRRLERLASKILGGRSTLRRPLDEMMSAVWELSDGSRTFEEICINLDELFEEEVAPVEARTAAAIELLARTGSIEVLTRPFGGTWNTGPGLQPDEENEIIPPDWLDVDEYLFDQIIVDSSREESKISGLDSKILIDSKGLDNQEE